MLAIFHADEDAMKSLTIIINAISLAGLAPHAIVLGVFMFCSLVTGLTRCRDEQRPLLGAPLRVARSLSHLAHSDQPGTFTVPTVVKLIIVAVIPKPATPKVIVEVECAPSGRTDAKTDDNSAGA